MQQAATREVKDLVGSQSILQPRTAGKAVKTPYAHAYVIERRITIAVLNYIYVISTNRSTECATYQAGENGYSALTRRQPNPMPLTYYRYHCPVTQRIHLRCLVR